MRRKTKVRRNEPGVSAQDSAARGARRWRPGTHWLTGAICGAAVAGLIAWSLPSQEPDWALTPIPGESDAWVMLEARNRDGSLAVPPAVLRSNENLRFHTRDPSQPEEVRVEVGYKPNAVLFVNLKAYPIQRIVQSEAGGRHKARAWVELPVSRAFEREWFMYMRGLPLSIRDVRPEAALEARVRLKVTEVLFTRKWTLKSVDEDSEPKRQESLVAVVTAKESVVQWLVRHWVRLVEHVWTWIVLPLIAALAPIVVQQRRKARRNRG